MREVPAPSGADAPSFLFAGGELGALVRAKDWSATPLGPVDAWPQSLRTAVSILLNSRHPMFVFWGPRLVKIYNDGYRPILGDKHPWALGQPGPEVWPEIWDDIGPLIDRVVRHAEATWSEDLRLFMLRRGFPEEVFFTFSYSPIRDESGGVGGLFCACTETTSKVLGERRLELLRELAAATMDARSVDVAAARALACLRRYPADVPFAAIDVGLRQGWPAGLQPVAALDPATLGVVAGPWPEPPTSAMVLPLGEQAGGAPAGALALGLSSRLPFDDAYRGFLDLVAGQVAAALANARASEEERRRAEALQEIDRAKTAFFSNVSHEFRTPLTLMLGPLEDLLASAEVRRDLRERLALIQRNALRMQKLVNSLLAFSRHEAGRAKAAFEPVDLAALTRDLASTFRSAIERAGLRYEVDCEPLDAPAYVDREMWEQVVLNLLSNALKFTLAGGVAVRLRDAGDRAVLEVADTGVGIPADELPRVFDRFHRVEGRGGRTLEGSGIGLALVQELVRLHGGTIEAQSAPEAGSTFRVTIPLGSAHLPAEAVRAARAAAAPSAESSAFVQEALRWLPDAEAPERSAAAVAQASGLDRRFAATFGARLVVADDNADMRAYVAGLLRPFYRVEAVADGAAALAAVRREPPALVLADVMMPALDGFGLLKALRADPDLQRIPVLLVSARAGEEARIEGLDAGADDYLVKPFSARELTARIGALLERDLVRRAAEDRLRRAFQRAPGFMCITEGPAHRYVFANDMTRRLFGRDPVGRTVREAFPELEAQGLLAQLDAVYATGRRFVAAGMHLSLAPHAGTPAQELDLDFVFEPMADDAGRVTGIFVSGHDVTEGTRARRALEAASRHKDEFLAMLAHELRNPLAPILNAGELLARRGVDDAEARSAIAMLQRQSSQLARLVDDLLDVARITQGRVELKREPVRLGAVVADAVESLAALFRAKDLHVTVVQGERALHVHADQARLAQVLVNLLTNAAKYTDPGGAITVTLREDQGEAVMTVADTGIGIPPELLPLVFDLFVQDARSLDRARGGLGIGLSVVRHLVEMHGGRVAARSDGPGRGSTFELRLPLIARPSAAVAASAPDRAVPRRVLVVDDNVDAAQSLAMLLAIEGHDVECAFAPADALARAPALRPDVVLLDIGLPGMDGYELARRLRRLPAVAHARLVAVTGYGQEADRARSREAGFDDHLVKPVEIATLNRVLRDAPPRSS